jgi:hypothetical protein
VWKFMRKTLGTHIEEIFDDLGYYTRRALTFMTGKAGVSVLAQSLPGVIITLTNFGGTAGEYVASTLAVSGVMGISAGLVQMDHNHRSESLMNRYREEIATATGKAPDKVQEQDLLNVADRNPTLRQALKHSARERNIGVVISAVSAAATYIATGLIFGSHAVDLSQSIGAVASDLLTRGLTGFAAYNLVKAPLHLAASQLLGLKEETVDDAIASIRRTRAHGKLVAQEQVLDVFIEAHPEIGKSVEAQFGKPFWNMKVDEKIQVMKSIPKEQLDLRKTTEDINLGHIKPEELAFMAFGQRSGVERKPLDILPKRPEVMDSLWNFLHGLTAGWTAPARETTSEEVAAALPELKGKTEYVIHTPDENTAGFAIHNTDEKDGAKRSFAAMVGRQKTPEGLTHVERYAQELQQDGVLAGRS